MSKKILFIVGSFRKDSFHKSIAEKVQEIIGNRAEVEFLDYKNVPLYNQDLEGAAPKKQCLISKLLGKNTEKEGFEAVTEVRQKALNSDAIWIFSPEYNAKVPGILKNLLDWLSRSLDENDSRGASAVHAKKVAITAAAGAPKAVGVRKELAELLPFMRMEVVGGEGVGLTFTADTWATGKFVPSEEDIKELEAQVDNFLAAL